MRIIMDMHVVRTYTPTATLLYEDKKDEQRSAWPVASDLY